MQLINDNMNQMYKVAKSRLLSDEDVGDAIQETILAAYKNLDKLKEVRYFKTWLIRILINKCNDIVSKSKNIIYIEDYSLINNGMSMKTNNESIEDRLDFIKTLEVLSEDYRTVVVLYYVNGFTTKEISEILGEKEGTIKSRLNRARQRLKDYYLEINDDKSLIGYKIGGDTL
ncbi:sigma-70 family RNA polymerase sigma factor [Caloramator sp. mosi_1]|uniref:RNA polymerase sigma factor n=1 Tax=Caloramator sp. mosi_1 TaxID=3023090 RepID=UPI002361D93D|nr:sigma-70 family RNA polymerase sigma factor [Caloramator sp. mosi_1]WDC85695.1 sigma-70 family RNA polymerase sigma factor [Caloramator sp. mosi_1]